MTSGEPDHVFSSSQGNNIAGDPTNAYTPGDTCKFGGISLLGAFAEGSAGVVTGTRVQNVDIDDNHVAGCGIGVSLSGSVLHVPGAGR